MTKGTSERDRGGKKERFQRAVKLISRGTLVCIYITCGSKEMEGKKKMEEKPMYKIKKRLLYLFCVVRYLLSMLV